MAGALGGYALAWVDLGMHVRAKVATNPSLPSQKTGVPALLPPRWDAAEESGAKTEKEAKIV